MASYAMPSPLPLIPGSETLPRLEVIDVGDHRTVQIGGHPVGCYRRDDVGSERVIATQLAEALTLDACEIAAAFGMHPVTLSRLRGQFRAAGSQALMPRKHGPKGPTKLTPRLLGRFRELREQGLSFRAIARRVSRPGREISYGSVAVALRGRGSNRSVSAEHIGLFPTHRVVSVGASEVVGASEFWWRACGNNLVGLNRGYPRYGDSTPEGRMEGG